MPHYTPLLTILVTGFGLAFALGYLAHRLKLSPIVGYLLAGVLIGPSTPGYIADPELASELAEIGVIFLMFGVGLHFSLQDLNDVKKIAIPGALVQIVITTLMGIGFGCAIGWTYSSGLVFGIALSVASTVVLLRALEEKDLVETINGKIAVGWLVVEDLAVILILVFLPPIAALMGHQVTDTALNNHLGMDIFLIFLLTIFKASSFVVLMLILGRRWIPTLLHDVAHNGSSELFRLAVLAVALTVAFIAAKLFGVSFALGAFFAGMMLSKSTLSLRAAEEILPLRDAFAVLFFVSVGMLLRPETLLLHPWLVLITTVIIIAGKALVAFAIVIAFRYPFFTAITISASLAQIGEFSFILAEIGHKFGLLNTQAKDLILAGAFISIVVNPMLFNSLYWMRSVVKSKAGTKISRTQ